MNTAQMRIEIQEMVNRGFDEWVTRFDPKRQEGKKGFRVARKTGAEFSWTTIDEFLQNFLVLSNGDEISYIAITIVPGIEDGDLYFTSDVSWESSGDELSSVNIEVVVTCQECNKMDTNCTMCQGTGEWVFLPNAWPI